MFKALSRWLYKLREHEQREQELALAEKRLALAREKLELNTARLALERLPALEEIDNRATGDDEDKIRAGRTLLFGANNSTPPAHDERKLNQ